MAGRKGRSGGRPLPTALKKSRGTLRKSAADVAREVRFPVCHLDPPDWLTDRYALEEWHRVVPLLEANSILTAPDLAALANYCSAWALALNATAQYEREGLVVEGAAMMRPHPLIAVAQQARAQCRVFAIEFGLTPAARSRVVGVPPEEKKDPTEEFLFHPPTLVVSNK